MLSYCHLLFPFYIDFHFKIAVATEFYLCFLDSLGWLISLLVGCTVLGLALGALYLSGRCFATQVTPSALEESLFSHHIPFNYLFHTPVFFF
jgi:hypothetical protein